MREAATSTEDSQACSMAWAVKLHSDKVISKEAISGWFVGEKVGEKVDGANDGTGVWDGALEGPIGLDVGL